MKINELVGKKILHVAPITKNEHEVILSITIEGIQDEVIVVEIDRTAFMDVDQVDFLSG